LWSLESEGERKEKPKLSTQHDFVAASPGPDQFLQPEAKGLLPRMSAWIWDLIIELVVNECFGGRNPYRGSWRHAWT